jgi:acyl-CoA synthetase (NDP forming)
VKHRPICAPHAARHPLDAIFAPRTVAVIGATERPGSVGRTVLQNLIGHSFGGIVFPINPNRHNILGIKAYPRVADAPAPIDLAVVVTPAPTVPDVMRECAEVGVRGVLRVTSIGDLFSMAEVLAKQPRPKGLRLTILTNAAATNNRTRSTSSPPRKRLMSG